MELLSDFFYSFPIELDRLLSRLSAEQIESPAKEDLKNIKTYRVVKEKETIGISFGKKKNDSILAF